MQRVPTVAVIKQMSHTHGAITFTSKQVDKYREAVIKRLQLFGQDLERFVVAADARLQSALLAQVLLHQHQGHHMSDMKTLGIFRLSRECTGECLAAQA
ncbi:hypothetical protein D3C77_524240 [compost metagenome]